MFTEPQAFLNEITNLSFHFSFSLKLDFVHSFQETIHKMPGQAKKLKLAMVHEIIPEEIFVMILKKLDFKNLAIARGVCSKWRSVIDGFELLSLKNLCK